MPDVRLILGDCLDKMAEIEEGSVDAVISDPPYPMIKREYGCMSEADWHVMMRGVVAHCRRILKPSGSAVFVLQANQEFVGRTRPWLWEFMAWTSREWNQVQDAWWWNVTAPPTVHCRRTRGLMRPSIKACVWLGPPNCYRDQDQVLWSQSRANAAQDRSDRALKYKPSGSHYRSGRCAAVADERGGVTPFNLIPIANADSSTSAGANGHGAGTPRPLCDWWTRYLTPEGGVVCDPFMGSGTVGLSASALGHSFIGIEKYPPYFDMAWCRLAVARAATPLFG